MDKYKRNKTTKTEQHITCISLTDEALEAVKLIKDSGYNISALSRDCLIQVAKCLSLNKPIVINLSSEDISSLSNGDTL